MAIYCGNQVWPCWLPVGPGDRGISLGAGLLTYFAYFPKCAKCRLGENFFSARKFPQMCKMQIRGNFGIIHNMKTVSRGNFFGRSEQLALLDELCEKRTASLVTCRGRRRIGKSTLIEEFARRGGHRFIKIEGRRPEKGMSGADELAAFSRQLSLQCQSEKAPPSDWPDAFLRLNAQIDDKRRTVVLLDEISWLAYFDRGFASDLKIAWDNLFKKHPKLILVLCGSVSSWIKDNIVDNSAFLGRRSLDIVVPEMPLSECVKFWGTRAQRIDPREIIDVLSVTGGVPRYLEEVNPSLSAEENIRRLCFRRNAVLRTDFDEMFRDVITEQRGFTEQVLRCLVDGPKTAAEVSAALKVGKGGRSSDALRRLSEAGFAADDSGINPETGEAMREHRYRLADNYSRFYLKSIEPEVRAIDSGMLDASKLGDFMELDSVMGLSFENLVVNNFRELLPALHLSDAVVTSAAPYRRRGTKGSRGRRGCQIDLLIQTRRTICRVEIKRMREIGREVIAEVEDKVCAIDRPSGTSVRTALVYDGHLSPLVKADGYFDAVIPFKSILGL